MTQPGTDANPLRVAIIGAGPSGFYVAEHLLKQDELTVEVDMFDRLPTPYGLVRGGVAPDHQKIKSVVTTYDRTAAHARFRYYGNVEFGHHVRLDTLRQFYHQMVFTTGAQTDRRMNIPGEDLQGSHAATEFVAWYNGHPDFRDRHFDFTHERAAVVGVGNVAVDVARILCRTPEELATTDIADYALDALRQSRIREVYMLGRRGPAQAAFTTPELKELGEMVGADLYIPPDEAILDDLSRAALESHPERSTQRKIDMLQAYSGQPGTGKERKLVLRFLVSPTELFGDSAGHVTHMRLVKNNLYATQDGSLRPRATEQTEDVPIGLLFRSVGYQGVALSGVPFDERGGVIPNAQGRILDPATSQPLVGLYVAGWIKRGPTGVIGTNRPDAQETVQGMMADAQGNRLLLPAHPDVAAAEKHIHQRQPDYVSYADWQRLDALEIARGKAAGRPRLKFTRVDEMLRALRDDTPR